MKNLRLVVFPGQLEEKFVEIPQAGEVTIGRQETNTVSVPSDKLSRVHATVKREGTRIVLLDRGSKNGTYVNNQRLARDKPHELHEGDSFQCAEVYFKLVPAPHDLPGEVAPTQVQGLRTRFSANAMEDLLGQSDGSALRVRSTSGENRANDKLQVLLTVSQLLSSPGPIEGLLERILDLVFQIMAVDRATILLVDGPSGTLRPRLTRPEPKPGEHPSGYFYSQRIVEYVRTNSVAALFSDTRDDPRLNDATSVVLQSIRSSMCVPLKPRDEVLGVLYVDNRTRPYGFSQEDLEFLTAFANQAAIALENSMLMRRIEREAAMRNAYQRFFSPATLLELERTQGVGLLETVERDVTILFSDISGFTELCSELEPTQVVQLLNDYFEKMVDIVNKYEGTLEKYIGDAMMVVWGAPFKNEDDTDRAVCAAVEMQQALSELNAQWRSEGRKEVNIHIGLNSGRVAAGNIGSEEYLQYAVIGDATNVASRVCSQSKEGEILMTEATFERWRARNRSVTALPPTSVRGVREPVKMLRLDWRERTTGDLTPPPGR